MRQLTATLVFIAFICSGCMDELHNYDNCVRIETARCQVRSDCDPGFDYNTCTAYYQEFCRTRKINSDDDSKHNMDACVEAILSLANDCSTFDPTVDETELLTPCSFLWPTSEDNTTNAITDASADAL